MKTPIIISSNRNLLRMLLCYYRILLILLLFFHLFSSLFLIIKCANNIVVVTTLSFSFSFVTKYVRLFIVCSVIIFVSALISFGTKTTTLHLFSFLERKICSFLLLLLLKLKLLYMCVCVFARHLFTGWLMITITITIETIKQASDQLIN